MNPLLLEFLGVVFRWLITSLGAYLVAHHVLTTDQEARFADGALRYLLDHLVIWGPVATGLLLGLWARYKGRLRFLAALQLPAGATEDEAAARATSAMVKAEAFTKVGVVLLACVLGGAAAVSLPACASVQPPAGAYSAAGLKAFNADESLKALTALSDTAINLNAAIGKEHLKDRDTALIRDFALGAADGVVAYANGQGNLAIVQAAFRTLTAKLSGEAVLNDKLRFVLALVASNINRLPAQ